MKKNAALLAIVALVSTPVFATHIGGFIDPNAPTTSTQKGGFVNPNGALTTVKQAQNMADNAWVTMHGNIEKRVGDDDYLFRDASGVMKVEIDHKRWEGQTVAPADKVEIQGKLDKNYNSVELDVKQIRKIQG
ncbi:YgiW/YdeI family stress tolerance OB fold protein [Erwinia endophytica]|uniref:YgiW/YdeI family stress tolerance OB fold protein n=1 Tax=Erwinia endophytica TaxID=1563158 RepID=UPI001265DCDA|nr:YgiW/YdeI family stress tolerance OB fold protein [Erwinia endophytica]KAB8312740.1 YgiW/YdeI family stress tolerance OB fold protein [Erwinia endophytica]